MNDFTLTCPCNILLTCALSLVQKWSVKVQWLFEAFISNCPQHMKPMYGVQPLIHPSISKRKKQKNQRRWRSLWAACQQYRKDESDSRGVNKDHVLCGSSYDAATATTCIGELLPLPPLVLPLALKWPGLVKDACCYISIHSSFF